MMAGFGRRMLLVEHDDNERNVLGRMLENEGYLVHQVSQECLALEEMKRRLFDVVISAHHMPHINGIRLTLLVRLLWPGVPTILLLDDRANVAHLADHTRATGMLCKPYTFGELLELVGNVIRSMRGHRPRTFTSHLLSSGG